VTVSVTITLCSDLSDDGLNMSTRYITLDNTTITNQFTFGPQQWGCSDGTGTITLTNGPHTLTAGVSDYFGNSWENSATFTTPSSNPTYSLAVTPDAYAVSVASGAQSQTFWVTNTGTGVAMVTVSASC